MGHARTALVAALSCVACSSSDVPNRTNGASLRGASIEVTTLDPIFGTLRALGTPLGQGGALERRGRHYRRVSAEPSALETGLPASADEGLLLSGRGDGVWIELTTPSARPVLGRTRGAAIVFERADVDTDVVIVADRSHTEEMRVLRSPLAPASTHHVVRTGPGVADVRLVEGRVQVLDVHGVVRIESTRTFAVDARGVRRDGTVTLDRTGSSGTFGLVTSIDTEGLVYPIAVDPAWSPGGAMSTARQSHGAALLTSGKVLAVGGETGATAVATAEIYDPATNAWSAAASMSVPRSDMIIATLASGKVLVSGGFADRGTSAVRATSEIYDPVANTWSPAGAMLSPRAESATVKLPSGKVLAIGGLDGGARIASVDVFDPATNSWSASASMTTGRSRHRAVLLTGGKVLVSGGLDNSGYVVLVSELYDPSTGAWAATGPMAMPRNGHAMVALPGGKAIALGGWAASEVASAELYDPASNAWTSAGTMSAARGAPAAIAFPGGQVLVIAGGPATGELYDPTVGTWLAAGTTSTRYDPSITLIAGGKALIAGGMIATSELFAPQTAGATCTYPGECLSGICVDGVCCDAKCGATCSACNVTGKLGTCSPVTGEAPHGARSCAPFGRCSAGACAATCAATAECATGFFCSSSKCVPKKVNGLGCSDPTDCVSGICVDGVCCNSGCASQCAACDVPGSFGTCTAVDGPPHGARVACTGVGAGTTCGIRCNGTDTSKCNYPTSTTSCGEASCSAGVERRSSACDGAGLCSDTAKSCGAYACGASACKVTCASASDCATGYYCKGTACVAIEGLGTTCTGASTCASGACVDGVCCASASCATGSACNTKAKAGRCAKLEGTACSVSDECGSGNCVDSVCCDAACAGQCEACDVGGSKGKCTGVAGAPHGARAKCPDGGGDPCKALACDGAKDVTTCTAFGAGASVVCKPTTCTGAAYADQATCDGKGTCSAPKTTSCVPFACDSKGCLTTCVDDSQCADGYGCKAGACAARAANCSADRLTSIPVAGGEPKVCQPYKCDPKTGECRKDCQSSDECASGSTCDTTTKVCVYAGGTSDGGGCQVSRTPRESLLTLYLSAMAVLAAVVRRRRTRVRSGLALLSALGASLAACNSSDARSHAPAETSPKAGSLVESLRATKAFPTDLGAGQKLVATAGGYRLGVAAPTALGVVLPERADAPLRVFQPGDESISLEIVAEGLRPTLGRLEEGALVFEGAADHTDVIQIAEPTRTEEIRVIRAPAKVARASYVVRLGSKLRGLREDGGRVQALDEQARVRLESAPIFAVDAAGVRRTGRVSLRPLDGGRTFAMTTEVDLEGLALPVAVDPSWSLTGTMVSARRDHAAVLLSTGKVLVAGGNAGGIGDVTTAEIYDPSTGKFSAVAGMLYTHGITAGIAIGSRVLCVGNGMAETYDPGTNAWTAASFANGSNLVKLSSGKVLLTGSYDKTTAVYDPASGTWSAGGSTAFVRSRHTATLLASGKVLVAGGENATEYGMTSAETYDPATNAWTTVGSLSSGRRFHGAARLPSGKVIVVGGAGPSSYPASAELFDPATGTFGTTAAVAYPSYAPSAIALATGRVLYAGPNAGSQVFDEPTSAWYEAGAPAYGRSFFPLVLLPSGAVLASGGNDGSLMLASAELYTPLANGTACTLPGQCASIQCLSSLCCDTACTGSCSACDLAGKLGTCSPVTGDPHYGRSCGGFGCNAGACRTSCSGDADCVSTHYCSGTTCVPKKGAGTTCAAAAQCTSGFCVDTVCCDSACGDQCAACDVAGHVGACWPVLGKPHASRTACAGTGLGKECGPACDGKEPTKCTFAPTTSFCSASACAAGVETHASLCDGSGLCKDVAKSCGAYACGPATCKLTCAANADCAAGYYCKGTACVLIEDVGVPCTSGATCKTGFCVDSVCCDRACDGQCEACDVEGGRGKCQGITGAPHGARPSCAGGGGDVCAAMTCAGAVDATKCTAYAAGPTTKCAAPICSGSTFTGDSTCDGAGKCQPPKTIACVPFACGDTGCLTSCKVDKQCATDFECVDSRCVPKGARCKDPVTSVSKDGVETVCAPYRCATTGECLTACGTSDDCAPGIVCNIEPKTCGEAPTTDSSGCAVWGRRERTDSPQWFLALAALSLVAGARARRRR